MKKTLYLILFLTLSFSSFSQIKIARFSNDSIKFFDEMSAYLISSRKDEGKDFMKEFSYSWYGGKFSDAQREGVYKITNLMLKKKKRPFPDFKNYLLSVSKFVNSKYQTEASFDSWQSTLTKLIKGRSKRKFADYLQVSNNLFEENMMYKSAAVQWSASNSNYNFGYDSLPTIEFPALNLICYSKKDSSVIYNTKGIYYPTEGKWVGKGGKVLWERAGFSKDSVFAELKDYSISLKSPSYSAKDVEFTNLNYFSEPLKGYLKEKVLANVKQDKATYPRFTSYNNRLQLKNVTQGVDYIGGLSFHGRKLLGSSTAEKPAYVIFYRKDKPFIKVESKSFIIRPEKITSEIAATTIYLKDDSIYHPGVLFKLFLDKRKIALIRDNKGIKISPYFNSFHQIDMNFEALYWNLDDPMMEFTNLIGGTKTDAMFTSSNFFKMDVYHKIQGAAQVNPLYRIYQLVNKLDTNFITLLQLGEHMRYSNTQLEAFLLNLNNFGFIIYNYDKKTFVVKDKLINYVKASGGNVDYDVINIFSNIAGKSNATLSLLNYDLTIRGVNSINVSDSQEVIIYPSEKEIVLKQNRDFTFGGVVQAGRFDFMGKEFKFLYNDFKVDLINVDSTRIYAESDVKDIHGKVKLRPVKSLIRNIKGELLIDNPKNKSGVQPYDEFPIFHSFKNSYVFYDRKKIQGGVYNKEDFYFQVKPFTIDSLDDFNNEALKFDGTFASAGIFPEFEETLTLQPDYSLGFVRKTPPGGYKMYGGKGTYTNDINLSHKGLRGDGELKYVTSTTYSNDFIFFPDSMNAVAQSYNIKESDSGVEFPPVEGENVFTRWFPKRDKMFHKKIDKAIAMYDMKSVLHGATLIEPTGLSGNGMFEFERAELESKNIKFKYDDFSADTANFSLKDSEQLDALAFSSSNVNAYVSFKERYGEFKSNGGGSYIEFPQNEYVCFMEEFKWYMDNDDIELSAGGKESEDASGVKLDGSQFISVNAEQDSLSWFSTQARYDLKKKIIYANGVKFMNVADAMIYPDSGKVVVEKKAKMRTLNNAKIIASYITQNYNIYGSTVNVFGKKKYAGNGNIDYVDELEQTQTIYLQNVGVDTTGQTYATGEITEETGFTLSPSFDFYGKVNLFANNQFLNFEGFSKIKHDCNLLKTNWFSFKSDIDPNEIYIPIDSTTRNIEGDNLIASILLSSDSLGVYTSFINRKLKSTHNEMITSSGYLFYDKVNTEYKISNKDKINEMSFTGNYISLNTNNCKIYGEGKVNLGAKTGQLDLFSAGNIQHNQLDNEVILDLVAMLDFHFSDDALKKMAKHMQEASGLDPIKLDAPTFEKGLREIIGKSEADKLIAQASLYGEFKKLPDELEKSLVLNEVRFKWNNDSKSYKSFGRIGIGNIKKEQVNKYVNGKIEIIKKRSGDVINIYLEIDPNNWYFFTYSRGILQSISSNSEFNTAIQEVKPDKRKLKSGKGVEPYQFMYSSKRKKEDFLRKFDD